MRGLSADFDLDDSDFSQHIAFHELEIEQVAIAHSEPGQAAADTAALHAELRELSARMRSIAYNAARLNAEGSCGVVLSIGTGSFPEWKHMWPARCIYICVDPLIDTKSIDACDLIPYRDRGCGADAAGELKSVITRVCASGCHGERRVLALKMSIEELLQTPGVSEVLRTFRVPAVVSFSHSNISDAGLEAIAEACDYVAMCGMALPSAIIERSRGAPVVVGGTCVAVETVGGVLHVTIAEATRFSDAPVSMESMVSRHEVERCASMPAFEGFSRELASIMFVRTSVWSPDTLVLFERPSLAPSEPRQPPTRVAAELEPQTPALQLLPREMLQHICGFMAYEPLLAFAKAVRLCSIGSAVARAEVLGRDGYRLAKARAFGEALEQPHLDGGSRIDVQGLQRINAGIGRAAIAAGVPFSDRANGRIRLHHRVRIGNASHQPPEPGENVLALTAQCLAVAQMHLDAQQAAAPSPDAAVRERSLAALAGFVFWRLTWIHPFSDGNGRTAHFAALHFASRAARSWETLLAVPTDAHGRRRLQSNASAARIDEMRLQCTSALAAALRDADAAWARASESCQRAWLCRLCSARQACDELLRCPWLRVGEVLIRDVWRPLAVDNGDGESGYESPASDGYYSRRGWGSYHSYDYSE